MWGKDLDSYRITGSEHARVTHLAYTGDKQNKFVRPSSIGTQEVYGMEKSSGLPRQADFEEGPVLSGFEIQELLSLELEEGLRGNVLLVLLDGLLSIFGGYVAGRMAKTHEIMHGLATGIGVLLVSASTTLLLGGGQAFTGRELNSWLLTLATAVMNISATTLGGYLAYRWRSGISRTEVE